MTKGHLNVEQVKTFRLLVKVMNNEPPVSSVADPLKSAYLNSVIPVLASLMTDNSFGAKVLEHILESIKYDNPEVSKPFSALSMAYIFYSSLPDRFPRDGAKHIVSSISEHLILLLQSLVIASCRVGDYETEVDAVLGITKTWTEPCLQYFNS